MTRSAIAALFCGILLSISAVPQSAQPPQRPTFTTSRTEVMVPVTVRDTKGNIVSNLVQADFRILDESRPQKVTYFYHDTPGTRQKTVIGFLVDSSNGNKIHWDKFRNAIKDLISELLPNDPNYTGYLISYGNREQLETDTTSDPDKLLERVDRLQPAGGAALYNAIHMACTDRKLAPGEPYEPRHIIIVIGDGHDSASQYNLDQAVELAQRRQVAVYGVSTLAFAASSADSDNLERLAKDTGGHVEYPLYNPYVNVPGHLSQPSDFGNYALPVGSGEYAAAIATAINKSVQSLRDEITSQYILHYVPDVDPATAQKETRRIEIKILSLPAGSVTVQARKYYYPFPPLQTVARAR